MTQDADGFIVIANNHVARVFDGATWRLIPLSTASAGIRKFATAEDGTIYAGGAGVIGYFRGTGDRLTFVSLADRLPTTELGCDEIHDVLAVGNAVFFADEEKILIWRDRRFTVIPCPTPPRSRGARLHRVGDTVFVTALDRALSRITGDRLEAVVDDPVFRQNQIIAVEAGAPGTLHLLTAGRGFFQLDAQGRVAPLPTPANRWLVGKGIYRAQRLGDGSLVVAFTSVSGDGGIRFAADGEYLSPIDNSIGLYVKTLRSFFCDGEGGLWIGNETGLFRLEWPSALTVFDGNNGLGLGLVADVVRHEGVLYAATGEGVYRLVVSDAEGRPARFERILNHPIYSLASHPGGLLAMGYGDLYLQSPDGFNSVVKLPPGGGTLHRSKRDAAQLWSATTRGIQSIRLTPQGWRDEGLLRGLDESVRSVSESADGSLWVSAAGRGLFHVVFTDGKVSAPQVERFAGDAGLPERIERVTTTEWAGEPIFFFDSAPRPFRFDPAQNRFSALAISESWPQDISATCPSAGDGERDALWLASLAGIYRARGRDGFSQRLPQLAIATAGAVSCLREENSVEGPVLWIGGAQGLVRVEVAHAFPAPMPFATLLQATGVRDGDKLRREHASVAFNFSAQRHQIANAVTYRTRLFGYDDDWSGWASGRERIFTSLPAGRYRFEVQARDANGERSAPASMRFAVLPAWWLTEWAFLGYAAAATAFIGGVVRFRTHALLRRAGRLEKVVARRTQELARKNTELTRLHRLELDEKISARLGEEKARLEVLRYQLNPHFLFNTLASISASLPAGRSAARGMLERLAEFCRLTLHRDNNRDWTTLGEEVRLLRAYLEIEQSRWGELLDVEIACDPALDGERLPHFLLLPLLENALKYGHATSPDRVGVRLATRRERSGMLVLEVANTGEWINPGAKKTVSSLGIGLDNLRERLAHHYPGAHELAIVHAAGWVTVTLRLGAGRPAANAEPPPAPAL